MLDVKTQLSPKGQKSRQKALIIFCVVMVVLILLLALSNVILNPILASLADKVENNPPAAGSYAEGLLKTEVWEAIKGYEATVNNCPNITSTIITIAQEPNTDGLWVENWSLNVCGQAQNLKVHFYPNQSGKTGFSITN